jgi:hypothetical protein
MVSLATQGGKSGSVSCSMSPEISEIVVVPVDDLRRYLSCQDSVAPDHKDSNPSLTDRSVNYTTTAQKVKI